MSERKSKNPPALSEKITATRQAREARLAGALRANLKRRKANLKRRKDCARPVTAADAEAAGSGEKGEA
ncbi:MAG: hypothetical protein QGH73_18135 [Rhodospirillales bacterium]|jgi:hypothetical protein|nr:hypothetical protein [Rhodospirillales bacterium]MDP6642644.1 hypothetical protein [Rhodospirillales bacterium]MDP6843594.1 hypothetical protein [Rhodospirillales bacterium]MDP6926198.1 hypothetical protein [Rhodospirillales bacterium]|tara:strand:+ start:194 stop:400 length:207 start_codon:yes stop_codon:yes gene_type:complete